MPILKNPSSNLHEFDKERLCHQELLTTLEIEDVQPCWHLRAICDDKLESRQGQCPLNLALIQNMSCHEIL
jgi:hypothetical protein